MTFPIRKSARKLTGIVKITIPEVFPEMKPLGNVIIFSVIELKLVSCICYFSIVILSTKQSNFTQWYVLGIFIIISYV